MWSGKPENMDVRRPTGLAGADEKKDRLSDSNATSTKRQTNAPVQLSSQTVLRNIHTAGPRHFGAHEILAVPLGRPYEPISVDGTDGVPHTT